MNRPVLALVRRNLLKFSRDRMRMLLTFLMSGLFLFVFSFATRSAAAGLDHPMNYLLSGVAIMTVFQASLNNSMGILEDISSGFMKEILVAPIARREIAIGQVLSSALVSTLQGIALVAAGFLLGLRLDPLHLLLAVAMLGLSALAFSAVGLYLAALAKDSSNFQLLVTLASLPLTFLSGAYIPVTVLPRFLLPVVYLNPLTYATAAFRAVLLRMDHLPAAALAKAGVAFPVAGGVVVTPGFGAFLVVVLGAAFLYLSVRRFSRSDFSSVKVFRHHH